MSISQLLWILSETYIQQDDFLSNYEKMKHLNNNMQIALSYKNDLFNYL